MNAFENITLVARGDSGLCIAPGTAYGITTTSPPVIRSHNSEWLARAAKRLRAGSYYNFARGGHTIADAAGLMYNNGPEKHMPVPMGTGCTVINGGVNDLAWDSAKMRAGVVNGLTHALENAGHASKILDTSFVKTGTWATPVTNTFSSGQRLWTATPGSSVKITFAGDSVVLTVYAQDDSAWAGSYIGGAAFQVLDDSDQSVLFSGTTSNQCAIGPTSGVYWAPMAIALSGFGSGTHNVKIVHNDTSNRQLWVDDAMIPGTIRPLVMVPTIPDFTPAYLAGHLNCSNALATTYNGIIAGVLAQFDNTAQWDVYADMDPDLHFHTDHLHHHDVGSDHAAGNFVALAESYSFSRGLNVKP